MLPRWFQALIRSSVLPSDTEETHRPVERLPRHDLIPVLLVEDNLPLRGIIKRILEREADICVVAEAKDGRQGHEFLRKCQPAVLVTDLMLPGLSGFELIRYAHNYYPHIAIVAVSNHSEDPYIRRALQRGANAFVHKACLPECLAGAVRRSLAGDSSGVYLKPGNPQTIS